jgi:hypothetical protein
MKAPSCLAGLSAMDIITAAITIAWNAGNVKAAAGRGENLLTDESLSTYLQYFASMSWSAASMTNSASDFSPISHHHTPGRARTPTRTSARAPGSPHRSAYGRTPQQRTSPRRPRAPRSRARRTR